jgi:hypothetical protein
MLENIPTYLLITFILSTAYTLVMLLKSSNWNKKVFGFSIAILGIQGYLGYSGFYTDLTTSPSHIALLVPPAFLIILLLFVTTSGRTFIDTLDHKTLTLLHMVRVPVEFCLLWLSMAGAIPELMTFEGRNFDIVAGLTAPIVYYLYFVRKSLSKRILVLWNITMSFLLLNIVVNALLAAPLPIQQFAFGQPNIAILHFPFVWLPSFIVPVVFFSHFVAIRKLLK